MRRIREVGPPVRIFIADDHTFLRGMLRAVVASHSRFEVCGETTTGGDAAMKFKELHPDVVLMNICTPETSGLDIARLVRAIDYPCAIVVLSSSRNAQLLHDARNGGTQAVARSEAAAAIIEAIENAAVGETGAATHYMDQPPARTGRAKAARASA